MIRNVVILTLNDLAIAFKNKTVYLILFIPLFIFLSLKFVDPDDAALQKIKIGLIRNEVYSPVMTERIRSAGTAFESVWLSNQEEGRRGLKERKIDGMLVPAGKAAQSMKLVVLTKASFQTVAIVEGVSALERALEGKETGWISEIAALQESGIQKQTLPTWILMLVLLVGFMIIPAQVAEEKEKKLLLGLLQTPIGEMEWLLAKVLLGMISIGIATALLHLLGRFDLGLGSAFSYAAFLAAGSFCFSAFGVFLGFLCRSQASARTLGVLVYLPHLLPSALSDFSRQLRRVAPLLPSYPFYEPIKSILLEGRQLSDFPLEWSYLVMAGLAAAGSSYLLMKRRWLM